MNANQLQAMLAVNAARITTIHGDIEDFITAAQDWAAAGEKAYAIEVGIEVVRTRRKLGKAVRLQQAMKIELLAIHRDARIVRKTTFLQGTVGFQFVPSSVLTSVEIESDLDDLIELLVPKKADSRAAA